MYHKRKAFKPSLGSSKCNQTPMNILGKHGVLPKDPFTRLSVAGYLPPERRPPLTPQRNKKLYVHFKDVLKTLVVRMGLNPGSTIQQSSV